MRLLALAAALLIGAGCTREASGPAFARRSAPPGKGTIYIYRPSAFSGGARTIFVAVPVEANNCFEMLNGGYLAYVADPGVVKVGASASGDAKILPVEIAAGEEKFVKVEWGAWGTAELTPVAAAEASADLAKSHSISACAN